MIHSLLFLFLRTQQDYRRKAGRVHHHRTIAGLIVRMTGLRFSHCCRLIFQNHIKIGITSFIRFKPVGTSHTIGTLKTTFIKDFLYFFLYRYYKVNNPLFPNHSAKFGTYCALILHRKKKIYHFLKNIYYLVIFVFRKL